MAAWLRDHADPAWRDRLDGTPEVRQFPGGAYNLTYLLTWPGAGSQEGPELILRRPPGGVKADLLHASKEYDLTAPVVTKNQGA